MANINITRRFIGHKVTMMMIYYAKRQHKLKIQT